MVLAERDRADSGGFVYSRDRSGSANREPPVSSTVTGETGGAATGAGAGTGASHRKGSITSSTVEEGGFGSSASGTSAAEVSASQKNAKKREVVEHLLQNSGISPAPARGPARGVHVDHTHDVSFDHAHDDGEIDADGAHAGETQHVYA